MSLQLVVFTTVRGIVQKTFVVCVDHQDLSAQLFFTKEEEIIKVHTYT
jgi:hypothetical protein